MEVKWLLQGRFRASEAPLQRQLAAGEPSLCQARPFFVVVKHVERTFELALNSEDCNFFQARFRSLVAA